MKDDGQGNLRRREEITFIELKGNNALVFAARNGLLQSASRLINEAEKANR